MLTRIGYIVDDNPATRKELTVRPIVNEFIGVAPPAFKVFRVTPDKKLCVPRFYGTEKFGQPTSDRRTEPLKINLPFVGKLRDETFQNEALEKGLAAGHGVLSLPCGFGKTTVALALASKLGYRTMIIVHKEFLATQWKERIKQFCPGATIGTIQQNKFEIENDFVIAMLQSLALKEYQPKMFDSIGTVFIDEAHHVCAKVFSQALFLLCPRHAFGLSATPNRKDGLSHILNWFMGPIFFSVKRENQEQVEVFPTDFNCKMFREPVPTTRFGKLSLPNMITMLVEHEERNAMLEKLVKKIVGPGSTRQLLVLTDRRWHCEYLQSLFPENSGLYMGGMKEADLLESSTKQIIFATFCQAHEGLDIASLDTVILATPKSDIEQSVGRIMRETDGKRNNPQIFDIVDHWSVLFAMFRKRNKVYTEGGFKISGAVKEERPAKNPFKGKCIL